ncbi:MAG: hypothetical protein IKT56_02630 [Clostridia bacterium]|nr:hypothetical protein [Clostridia bacterium]
MHIDKTLRKIDFFNELYERAKSASSEIRDSFEKHYAQYRGDKRIDNSSEDASAERNITYEIIESQISSEIPQPQVTAAVYSEGAERNAKAIERLCAQLRDRLPFEKMNDMDERYTYIFGGSIWLIEWDETLRTRKNIGGVKINVISPQDFIPQPYIYEIQDMDYCFVRCRTTKEEIIRKYNVRRDELEDITNDAESNASEDDDTADVVICFYKNDNDKICKYVFSGDTELLDIDNYYARKGKTCKVCGAREGICECPDKDFDETDVEYEVLERDITLSDGRVILSKSPVLDEDGKPVIESVSTELKRASDGSVSAKERGGMFLPAMQEVENVRFEPTKIPYYMPSLIPIVVRKNTSQDRSLFGQSDCEYLRPYQQEINKLESRIMQKLIRAGITPVIPEDAKVALNNSIFGQVIKLKPGESPGLYGVIDTTPNITQDLTSAERVYNMAKRVIGITDSFQGNSDTTAKSGIAKQVQVQQAAGRLDSKRRMKNAAYAEIDAIIFQQYLAYCDEPRKVAYKDAYGRIHNDEFNRYSFIVYDETKGDYYYDDDFLFSVDQNNGVEQQRSTMWEINLNNLSNGSFGPLNDPSTMLRYWQAQERVHYPHARENVHYFENLAEQINASAHQTPPALSAQGTI